MHGNMQSSFRRVVIKEGWSIVWVSTAIASSYYTSVTSNEKNQPKKKKEKKRDELSFCKAVRQMLISQVLSNSKMKPKKIT